MSQYQVISLDMFQTLVNIEDRRNHIWSPILQQDFSEERALELGHLLLSHYFAQAAAIRDAGSFCSSHEIFRRGFEQVFLQHALKFDVLEAVDILFAQHRLSGLYEDTEPFLRRITAAYQVCIVSDTDIRMLPDFYKDYSMKLFTSEEYGSYKNDGQNRMFSEVIAFYGIEPGQILHIGDSPSDVLGAARAGIKSCWINRNGSAWKHEIQPDYTVGNLEELFAILEPSLRADEVPNLEPLRYPIGPFVSLGPQTAVERRESIAEIRSMASILKETVQPLTLEQLNTPYRPGGWSTRQVVHHLADNNMNAYLRFKRGLTEEVPEIPSYREDLWAVQNDYLLEPVETSLALLESLNLRFACLLDSLEEQQFHRTFLSQMLGTMTLDTAVQRYNWHNRHHLAQVTSLIARSGW